MVEKISDKKRRLIPIINLPLKLFFCTPKAKDDIDIDKAKEILVIYYAGIGDAIMNISFLRILRNNAPRSKITLVSSKSEYEVVKNLDLVDKIAVIDLAFTKNINKELKKIIEIRKVIRKINNVQYDVAIEPRGDLRCIYLMHKCNAIRKISYNYTGGESLLTDVINPSKGITHLLDDQLYILKSIGIEFTEKETLPVLELNHEDEEKNNLLLDSYDIRNMCIVGIHPGASWETKRWKDYDKLAQRIGDNYKNIYFFVFSSAGEEKIADEVLSSIISHGLEGRIIKEALEDYIRIIANCSIMICNDSGSAHIAAAYGISTIVIFGPFDPSYCKPVGRGSVHVISHDLDCKPCMSKDCKTKKNECLNGISVDEVLEVVMEELRKHNGYVSEKSKKR